MSRLSVYLAAPWRRRGELVEYAYQARMRGLGVTSKWLYSTLDDQLADAAAKQCARDDLADIDEAHLLVAFTDGEPVRGGYQFETGYAYARGMKIIVVGPREHVFHWLTRVTVVPDWSRCLQLLVDLDQPAVKVR